MALIQGAYGGGTIIGKSGGVVFQRNPYGNVMREKTLPVNPSSARQVGIRSALSQLAASWKALTPEERDAWNWYASQTPIVTKKGLSQLVTGRAMYIRANVISLNANQSEIVEAPTTPGLLQTIEPVFNIAVATGLVVASEPEPTPPFTGDTLCQVQLSPPLDPSRNYFKGPFIETYYFNPTTATFPLTLQALGGFAVGQRRVIRYRFVDQLGKVSSPGFVFLDITA